MSEGGDGSVGLSVDRSTHDVLLNDIGKSCIYTASSSGVQRTPPVLTPTDRGPGSLERLETLLEGEPISAFVVGGEKRLCFPQVLNAVLRDVPFDEVNRATADLNINTPQASPAQLNSLKLTGVLPRNTASCGLITNSDAERLVNYLQAVRRPGQRLLPPDAAPAQDKLSGLPVRHDCFGGARGALFPDLYAAPDAACLECTECGHLFRPAKFVVHSHHQGAERRTCHWGFDSAHWRSYLRLQPDAETTAGLVDKLNEALVPSLAFPSLLLTVPSRQVKQRFEPSQLAARQLLKSSVAQSGSSINSLAARLGLKRKAEEVGSAFPPYLLPSKAFRPHFVLHFLFFGAVRGFINLFGEGWV